MKAKRTLPFEPDYAVPPGASLEEMMHVMGMTQRDLAERTSLSVQTLNRIFKGEQPITFETANRLELVTGSPASFWNRLEAQYREQLAKAEQATMLAAQLDWLQLIPTKELQRRGSLPDTTDKVVLLREALRFFGVSSPDAWHAVWARPAVAARRSKAAESKPGATSAWLRLGQLKARETECDPFDRKLFLENLATIRALTVYSPEIFLSQMKQLCAMAGVAFVLVPEIKGAPWNGAAEWLSSSKAMILLNLRGKTEDKFWFSFFHEAGHLLHDSKKETYLDEGSAYANDPNEARADGFASEILIPAQHNEAIAASETESDIRKMAKQLKLSPGIVAGRYQHLTKRWTEFHELIQRFDWAAE